MQIFSPPNCPSQFGLRAAEIFLKSSELFSNALVIAIYLIHFILIDACYFRYFADNSYG